MGRACLSAFIVSTALFLISTPSDGAFRANKCARLSQRQPQWRLPLSRRACRQSTGCTRSRTSAVSQSNNANSSNCHPSYSGCLRRDASDYDCAEGCGNGPNYTGRIQVPGSDDFDFDRDGDGWGCE